MGWRRLTPTLSFSSPLLKIDQLHCLPGRRIPVIDRLSVAWQIQQIRSIRKKDNPLCWVQGSLDERICASLSEIHIFSAFDDAHLHQNGGALTERAQLIVSQNQFAHSLYQKAYPHKSVLSLPPVELTPSTFQEDGKENRFAHKFSQPVIGYLGACFPEGYDFELLEFLIQKRPQWGFVIAGRTDDLGLKKIEQLKQYSNFIYHPHIEREKLASLWRSLSINLMLYRPCRQNSGAFPVKILEAAFFGVPTVATETPKTSGLKEWVSCSSDPHQLLDLIQNELREKKDQSPLFDSLFYEMHPKVHLAKIAEALGEA